MPEPSTFELREAYRRELRRVAWPWRVGGLLLVVIATALLVSTIQQGEPLLGSMTGRLGIALMLAGWAMAIRAIIARTAYHRRRMAEDA